MNRGLDGWVGLITMGGSRLGAELVSRDTKGTSSRALCLMVVVHAIWAEGTLHLWGERNIHIDAVKDENSWKRADRTVTSAPSASFFMAAEEFRSRLGDVWDGLLVSTGQARELNLRLPHCDGRFVSSPSCSPAPRPSAEQGGKTTLRFCRVATLSFSPADAFDILVSSPHLLREEMRAGSSLLYWSKVAALLRELLAKQQFVPATHATPPDHYRGYWRVVVNDPVTSDRLRYLIGAMPPLCRSHDTGNGLVVQAVALVENFLWVVVDSLVRRCLDGDELAHAIHERHGEDESLEMRWLRSLVGSDATLTGLPRDKQAIHESVLNWLGKLEPSPAERLCRTCFRLHPPVEDTAEKRNSPEPDDERESWTLTFHVQVRQHPSQVLDASALWDESHDDPAILSRPFDSARKHFRKDMALAARFFPPLAPCAQEGGPLQCLLTLEEAYRFLRDASPALEAEGFGVWLPALWQSRQPGLRMMLDLRPIPQSGPDQQTTMRLESLVDYDWRIAIGDKDLTPQEISRLAEAKAPLVKLHGLWAQVQPADAEAAMRFLQKNRSGRLTVFEALRLSYLADDLDTGLPVGGLRAHGWIEKLLTGKGNGKHLKELKPPQGFHGTLRPYQREGLNWFSFLSRHGMGACLADDMGLGKTIQLIALLLHEREAGERPGPTLLIVPMSLVGNWQRELKRFAPTLEVMIHHGLDRLTGTTFAQEAQRHAVVLSTYGLAHRDHEHLARVAWQRITLDEAQNIKNPAAKQSVAIRSLQALHRVALTGTPVENRLSELWSIMDFLNPGYLGTATDFRRRFAVPVERHHDSDRANRLRELIRPFVLRRLKSDPHIIDDLPKKLEMTVFCNLTREQAALYEALVNDMLSQIEPSDGIRRRGLILATLVKLKQICNHPVQFLGDGSALPHRSGKCDRLGEMLDEVVAENDRALIFTQFRQMGDLLQKYSQQRLGCEILFLHGGTPRKQRDRIVEQFQKEERKTPLLILSLKAGGFGLNLTAANHVFHYDRWWNPAVEDQATDRAHRIGQTRRVQVHKFVCIGTLEERIAGMMEVKRKLADRIIGSGEQWLTELSTDTLRELFLLSREAVAGE